jgi:DNA-binding XRE family transcriptional regulator
MKRFTRPIEWVTNEKGCHLVTSLKPNKDGYIKVTRNKKNFLLHRLVYSEQNGEIPKKSVILHTCDNPSCINIEHLRLGTQQDNLKDMLDKGRHRTKSPKEKTIKPKLIAELREKAGLSGLALSKRANISSSYLSKIEKHEFNGSVDVLNRIAEALNVEFTDLFK